MSAALLVGLVVVGAAALAAAGYVVLQLLPLSNGAVRVAPVSPARRLTAALALALVVAVLVGEAISIIRGPASFAAAGEQRYISAPVVYGAFALIAVTTIRHFSKAWPVWVIGLLVITALSTLFSPLAGPRFTLSTLLQGIVLFGGGALFAVCGLLDAKWEKRERRRLLQLLLGAGGVAGVLGFDTGIFSALVIPSAVALIYLARERVRLWPLWVAAGVFIIVEVLRANADAIDPSAASNGQLVIALALFALAIVPLRLRLFVVAAGAAAGVVLLLGSDVPGLFLGIGATLPDVTLAERAYETQQVVRQAAGNPVALLLGAGPGATVDLTSAPDAATLAASGRVLPAVPSVHLITSYFLLKTGLLGVIWLGSFIIAAALTAVRVLSSKHVDLFDLVLVALVLCGIVQAIPAATFILSNPLPVLLLALLHIRSRYPRDVTTPVAAFVLR